MRRCEGEIKKRNPKREHHNHREKGIFEFFGYTGEMSAAEAIEQLSASPLWVWTAIDPESKLLLSVQAGDRTLAMAQAMLHQIAQLLAPGCVPLFLSDGNPNYLPAIVSHFGHWMQPPRRHNKGSAP